jgi:hypothetical protein
MKKIFTTKISLQSSNPKYAYPIIRLPRDLRGLAGETVSIYQAELDGVSRFFVVPKVDNLDKFVEDTIEDNQELCQAPIDQSTLKIDGLGRI